MNFKSHDRMPSLNGFLILSGYFQIQKMLNLKSVHLCYMDCFEIEKSDNENYAGFIIPPIPLKADISETRIKFARLDELEGTMNREEFERLKEQVTEEYLAIFKKTVSDHEHFLRRIMQHEKMVHDHDFRIFLTFKDELEVRGRNTQEKIKGFFSNITKAADEGIWARYYDFWPP